MRALNTHSCDGKHVRLGASRKEGERSAVHDRVGDNDDRLRGRPRDNSIRLK